MNYCYCSCGLYFVSRTNLAQAAVAQSPSTEIQNLPDTSEHPNEVGPRSLDESDKESLAVRQKDASSDITYSTQPKSPTSEGLLLIHPHLMTYLILYLYSHTLTLHADSGAVRIRPTPFPGWRS